MKNERLFRILGLLPDDLIEEAETAKLPRRRPVYRVLALAACCALVLGGISLPRLFSCGSGAPSGSYEEAAGDMADGGNGVEAPGAAAPEAGVPMDYHGPILPLQVENSEGIVMEREISFDFSQLENVDGGVPYAGVVEYYRLTNTTGEEQTLTLVYPYIGTGRNTEDSPVLDVVGGQPFETTLTMGALAAPFRDDGMNLGRVSDWKGWLAALEKGETIEPHFAREDETVTIAEFTDVTEVERQDPATLQMAFTLPEGTEVLTNGMNGFSAPGNRMELSFFISHTGGQQVIFLGEVPDDVTLTGWVNGACEEPNNAISGRIIWHTDTLENVLHAASESLVAEFLTDAADLDADLRYAALCEMLDHTALGSDPQMRYEWMRLDDLALEGLVTRRIFYLRTEVTVPAGETVTVAARQTREMDYPYGGTGAEPFYSIETLFAGADAPLIGMTVPKGYAISEKLDAPDSKTGCTRIILRPEA